METDHGTVREPDITRSLVSRLIATQFPEWSGLTVVPTEPDGWDNRTFRLGDDKLVRPPSAAAYAAQVEKEQRWLPALAPMLPLPIPSPVAMGEPGEGYSWRWSVYRWLDGEPATIEIIGDREQFARDLATFLRALQRIDTAGGPRPGAHNFYRGGPVATYHCETRRAIALLGDDIDADAATAVWEAALASVWLGPDVWVHGDVSAANLLVTDGELSAVIDFGCSSVGDPACDLTIAWTFLSGPSREVFREAMTVDDATWARAHGWALWKALITVDWGDGADARKTADARRVIDEVLADHHSVR